MEKKKEKMIGVHNSTCGCICLQLGISIVHLSPEQVLELLVQSGLGVFPGKGSFMNHVEMRELLSHSWSSKVEICERGILHVHSGPTTLHLTQAQCKDLTKTLSIAMVKLNHAARIEEKLKEPQQEKCPGHLSLVET